MSQKPLTRSVEEKVLNAVEAFPLRGRRKSTFEGKLRKMETLHAGMESLHAGMESLHAGMESLHAGMDTLQPGTATLAPFQGADNFSLRSGGLRCASTIGYSLPTLRVATILRGRPPTSTQLGRMACRERDGSVQMGVPFPGKAGKLCLESAFSSSAKRTERQ